MIWDGDITYGLDHIRWGLTISWWVETNIISTLPNYGIVGFVFGGGNQLVPLMQLGFRGIPPLGLDHNGLVISLSFGVCCPQRRGYGGDLQTYKVSFSLEFLFMLNHFSLKLEHCHTSNARFRCLVVGAEGWWRAA